jgi:nucleoside 2-deoxyribosyltransferase
MSGKAPIVQLTLRGWQQVQDLRSTSSNSDQAFVAMSFDDDIRPLFANAIAPALDSTGYAPFRVDGLLHNEKIDDRIVAEIRQSGLLVADFTQQKNGVYWEAGFAQGLGIPVIRTCHTDDIKSE